MELTFMSMNNNVWCRVDNLVFSSYCNYYLKKKCPSSAQSDFMSLLARPVAAALPRQVSQYPTADLPKVCCTGTSSGTRIINLMSVRFFQSDSFRRHRKGWPSTGMWILPAFRDCKGDQGWGFLLDADPISPKYTQQESNREETCYYDFQSCLCYNLLSQSTTHDATEITVHECFPML